MSKAKKPVRVRIRGTNLEGEMVAQRSEQEGRLGGNTVYYVVKLDNGTTQEFMRDEVKFI